MEIQPAIEKPIFYLTEEDSYSLSCPNYYQREDVEGIEVLENNWELILDEFSRVLDNSTPIECSSPNPPFLSGEGVWKNIYFYNFMWKYHENCKKFPVTYNLLKKIPYLSFAEVTILEPNSEVLPHVGETNITIRGHLGLSIPGQLPEAGIEVNGESRSWEDGKVVLFSDAHRHWVWNHTNKRRMILIFDIVRKEFQNKTLWYNAQALSTLVIKGIDSKVPIIKKLPRLLQWGIHYIFSIGWYVYLPIQRKISWLP